MLILSLLTEITKETMSVKLNRLLLIFNIIDIHSRFKYTIKNV